MKPEYTLAKRVKRVERRVASQRPETKHHTIVSDTANVADNATIRLDLTNIQRGDGVDEREGNKIKVWRIEVRGNGSNRLDQYILQGHNDGLPGAANFTAAPGAFLLTDDTNTNFTEWRHFTNTTQQVGDTNAFRFTVKFKYGIVVRYEGAAAADCVDNPIYYFCLNRSGATVPMGVSVRMWYSDA